MSTKYTIPESLISGTEDAIESVWQDVSARFWANYPPSKAFSKMYDTMYAVSSLGLSIADIIGKYERVYSEGGLKNPLLRDIIYNFRTNRVLKSALEEMSSGFLSWLRCNHSDVMSQLPDSYVDKYLTPFTAPVLINFHLCTERVRSTVSMEDVVSKVMEYVMVTLELEISGRRMRRSNGFLVDEFILDYAFRRCIEHAYLPFLWALSRISSKRSGFFRGDSSVLPYEIPSDISPFMVPSSFEPCVEDFLKRNPRISAYDLRSIMLSSPRYVLGDSIPHIIL